MQTELFMNGEKNYVQQGNLKIYNEKKRKALVSSKSVFICQFLVKIRFNQVNIG